MRILLLYNVARDVLKGTRDDLTCELEIEVIAPLVRDALVDRGHAIELWEANYDLWERLKDRRQDFDIVFNLAEAFGGTNRFEPLVPAMLEALSMPFTGAGAHTMAITLDKVVTKRIAAAIGVETPRYLVATGEIHQVGELTYPLIVKPIREEASIGISHESVVHDLAALNARVALVRRLYEQPSLIEEFVDGREVSVGMVGNGAGLRALPPVEFLFDEEEAPERRMRSYDYKWGGRKETMVEAKLSPALLDALRTWAIALFEACECRDYARMDFRVQGDAPYLLEVNYNPGIGPNTHGLNNTLTMMASFEGGGFGDLVAEIVEVAAAREGLAVD